MTNARRRRRRRTAGLVAQRLLMVDPRRRPRPMLETIAVILIILWLLGMVSGYTLGNFIDVLLVIAIVLFLVRLISGRRVCPRLVTRATPPKTSAAAAAIR